MEEFPWLATFGDGKQTRTSGPNPDSSEGEGDDGEDDSDMVSGCSSPSASDESSDAPGEQKETINEDDVLAALSAKRVEMQASGAEAALPFAWRVMGGAWTREHMGTDFDAFRGEARSTTAHTFATMYSLQRSASFSLALYGEDSARILSEYWCAKMNFLFAMWDSGGRGRYAFAEGDLGFSEPGEFVDLLSRAQGKVLARMRALQRLRPSRPR